MKIPDETAIKATMAAALERPAADLRDEADLAALAAESFLLVQMVMELQEEYPVRIRQEDLLAIRTVGDLVSLVLRRLAPPDQPPS